MISFRYHLVTIVAVFLALGLGVLMGTTVVKQSVINNLQTRADNAIETTHRLQGDLNELNREVQRWDAFGRAARSLLIDGTLQGRSVALVTAEGVDFSLLDGVRRALRDAGAEVTGVLVVTRRMGLVDQRSRGDLAGLLELDVSLPATDLSQQAGARLGSRLADGPSIDPASDLLRDLVSAGFLQGQAGVGGGLDAVGGADQAVVVLSGGSAPVAPAPKDFFLPLVTSLVQASHPVAAGEAEQTRDELVSLVRLDGTLDSRVLTVDNADSPPGQVALVLGLGDLLGTGLGPCGDFGIKAGACGLLPQPSPTP